MRDTIMFSKASPIDPFLSCSTVGYLGAAIRQLPVVFFYRFQRLVVSRHSASYLLLWNLPRSHVRSSTMAIHREHTPLLMDQPISRGLHFGKSPYRSLTVVIYGINGQSGINLCLLSTFTYSLPTKGVHATLCLRTQLTSIVFYLFGQKPACLHTGQSSSRDLGH